MMAVPMRLLYVDDDADVRRVAVLSLRLDDGLEVTEAASANEAIRMIDAAPDRFDLFVFDVMMPEIDGVELMKAVGSRSDAAARVPVILMTARARPADIVAYREAGARGVIVKPFDPIRLAGDVRALAEAE